MAPSSLRLIRDRITRAELALLATEGFGDMVKAVVDVERLIMVVGGEHVVDASTRARIRAAVTQLVAE